jgi:hypothetical protein
MSRQHLKLHRSGRAGWLRAAVLGADDGIVSTASLMIGVAASAAPGGAVLVAGFAGLVAGAMSMAAGEYVSVSSQRDAEEADIQLESTELERDPRRELDELTELYVRRGLEGALARTVAERLTAVNPLDTHLREELGLTPAAMARPVQAALVSALSFALWSCTATPRCDPYASVRAHRRHCGRRARLSRFPGDRRRPRRRRISGPRSATSDGRGRGGHGRHCVHRPARWSSRPVTDGSEAAAPTRPPQWQPHGGCLAQPTRRHPKRHRPPAVAVPMALSGRRGRSMATSSVIPVFRPGMSRKTRSRSGSRSRASLGFWAGP